MVALPVYAVMAVLTVSGVNYRRGNGGAEFFKVGLRGR